MRYDTFGNTDIIETFRLETWNRYGKYWECNLTFGSDRISWDEWLCIREEFIANNRKFRLVGHYVVDLACGSSTDPTKVG